MPLLLNFSLNYRNDKFRRMAASVAILLKFISKTIKLIIMYTKITKAINVVIFFLFIIAYSSCTTTQMTISPRAYNSTIEEINSDISSIGKGYQLTGSGADAK